MAYLSIGPIKGRVKRNPAVYLKDQRGGNLSLLPSRNLSKPANACFSLIYLPPAPNEINISAESPDTSVKVKGVTSLHIFQALLMASSTSARGMSGV